MDDLVSTKIAFVKNYSGPYNLLGRADFFDRHKIIFEQSKLKLTVEQE